MIHRRDLLKSGAAAFLASASRGVRAQGPKPRRILILGGTGFIGPHIVHAALARGHQVSMLNRGQREPNQNAGDFARVEAIRGDRSLATAYASLAGKRWDVVIDTGAGAGVDARSGRGAQGVRRPLHLHIFAPIFKIKPETFVDATSPNPFAHDPME